MVEKIAEYVKRVFKGTGIGDRIINFIRIREIDEKLFFIEVIKQYRKDAANPSTAMIESRKYFKQNRERVKHIVALLADEESKLCYRKAIQYRYTHDLRRAPKYTRNIYFPRDIIHLSDHEVFIDGGAFVGDTIRVFYKKTSAKYKKIVAFEPDTYNYKMLTKLKYHDVVKNNMGLWDDDCELNFTNGGGCGSRMSEHADSTVIVRKLDNLDVCQNATYIKLDIEGSELNALMGAENLIKRNHPKLAVCLYHSDEDMIRIIEYIHNIEPDYHIYVRHHSIQAAETVMYAVYKGERTEGR